VQLLVACNSFFAPCSVLAKLALLLLYLRLFDVRRAMRYAIKATIAAVVVINAAYIALIAGIYARRTGENAYAATTRAVRPTTPIYVAHAVFNAVSDVWLLAIPVYAVSGLQMSARRKLATAAAFTTGLG
jgi:hypothetical protein